jgi:DNA ligase-1
MSVYQILTSIENTSGSNAKRDILKEHAGNDILKMCFNLALTPRLNFYIKKIPAVSTHAGTLDLQSALRRLEALSNREITGNAAKAYVKETMEALSAEDAYVFKRVLGRDMKCGVSISTVNKIWKDMIPTYAYMRCSLPVGSNIKNFPWKKGVYIQTKMDGMFSNNIGQGNSTHILSRAGSPFPSEFAPALREELLKLKNELVEPNEDGVNIHGELLIWDINAKKYLSRKTGNGMLNSCLQDGDFDSKNYDVHVVVWDYVPIENWVKQTDYNVAYSIRFTKLINKIKELGLTKIVPINCEVVYSKAEALAVYRKLRQAGEEGAVLKNPDMIWEDATSKDQVKMKVVFEIEVEITGFNPGNGKNEKYFGSIAGKSADGLLTLNAGGITDDDRKHIHSIMDQLIGKIMTVEGNDLTDSEGKDTLSVFLPRFIEIRLDKTTANTMDEIKAIHEAAQFNIFGGEE